MQLELKDKVVLVTGGTKGIGRAIVEGFLAEGARVYFCSRTEGDATSQSAEFGSSVDIANQDQVEKWVDKVFDKEKRIDVVVSNVSSLSVNNSPVSWTSAWEVDMRGMATLVNAAIPHLEMSKGNIITISSVSGRDIDFTAPSPYGAFKAAVIHYTAQLAHTLARKGVRANTVSPGNIYIKDGVWGNIERDNPELFKAQLEKNPMGRMGKASEISNAVVFLASEKATFISGTNLVVDGALCTGVQF